jgi:hypothetical protein
MKLNKFFFLKKKIKKFFVFKKEKLKIKIDCLFLFHALLITDIGQLSPHFYH